MKSVATPRARSVHAIELDYHAHRAALLERDARDLAGERLAPHAARPFKLGAILTQRHQSQMLHRYAAGARRAVDQVFAARRHGPGQFARADDDRRRRLRDRYAGRWCSAGAGRQVPAGCGGAGSHRMRRPLERTVRPVGQRPGLDRRRARAERELKCLVGRQAQRAARPGHTERGALEAGRRLAVEPTQRRAGHRLALAGEIGGGGRGDGRRARQGCQGRRELHEAAPGR